MCNGTSSGSDPCEGYLDPGMVQLIVLGKAEYKGWRCEAAPGILQFVKGSRCFSIRENVADKNWMGTAWSTATGVIDRREQSA